MADITIARFCVIYITEEVDKTIRQRDVTGMMSRFPIHNQAMHSINRVQLSNSGMIVFRYKPPIESDLSHPDKQIT